MNEHLNITSDHNYKMRQLFISWEYLHCGKQRVPQFAVEDLFSSKLQPRFLSLQWRTCAWAEHSDDDDDDDILHYNMGRRAIGISGSLNWSKTLMELIFNPFVNFGDVHSAQIAKSTLLASKMVPMGSFQIFYDLFRC